MRESIEIMQINKTPIVKAKNIAPGITITKYISSFKTSRFHAVFVTFLLDAIQNGPTVLVTTDEDILKTKAHLMFMKYCCMETFQEFTRNLMLVLAANDGKWICAAGMKSYSHEEFAAYTSRLEAMLVIKIENGQIFKN